MKISVVVPWYKSQETVTDFYNRVMAACSKIPNAEVELIMVEDCGGDRSWELISNLAYQDHRVKALQFSRNFGQHSGITAGLDHSTGDWVVVMDCDLQDQPEEIPNLYARAIDGNFDIVYARRQQRKDAWWKVITSKIYASIYNYLSGLHRDPTVANFSILSRKVVDAFCSLRETGRAFGGHLRWLGFCVGYIDVQHHPSARDGARSSYTLKKLIQLALNTIVTYSNKPLQISVQLGFGISFASFLVALYFGIKKIIFDISVSGWTSLMVSLWFIGGLIIANLGIIGLYLGRVYDETKQRPLYVISHRINI